VVAYSQQVVDLLAAEAADFAELVAVPAVVAQAAELEEREAEAWHLELNYLVSRLWLHQLHH
jgi:hypothetical protein